MKTTSVIFLLALSLAVLTTACGSDDEPTAVVEPSPVVEPEPETEPESEPEPEPEPATSDSSFAKGADVSWLTEMEAAGVTFYDASGNEMECMALLKSIGMDAIRLRVWVDPEDGWCGKDDVVAKAVRAHDLGFRLLIDFHYSDTWADPAKQLKPAAWSALSLSALKEALAEHTTDVLTALKDRGIEPEWVQVGNEVRSGMLWDSDKSTSGATWDASYNGVQYYANEQNFADFITTGYDAVKSVLPDAKVVVHLDNGDDNSTYQWLFGDILNKYSAKYDVIGMSLYPESAWSSTVSACIANAKDMVNRYGKEVMLCEVGMAQEPASTAKACLTELITQLEDIDECLGVFYWEPECYNSWNGYNKGAFSNDGRPTEALDAFK